MTRKTTAYQNRLQDIKKLEAKVWKLETQNDTLAFDNKEMQRQYDLMESVSNRSARRAKRLATAANFWGAVALIELIVFFIVR